jgi:hypothetical protein
MFAAVVWVGGGANTQAMAFRIIRADDPRRMAGFAKDVEKIGMFVYLPASILVLAFGFVLVAEGSWAYDF